MGSLTKAIWLQTQRPWTGNGLFSVWCVFAVGWAFPKILSPRSTSDKNIVCAGFIPEPSIEQKCLWCGTVSWYGSGYRCSCMILWRNFRLWTWSMGSEKKGRNANKGVKFWEISMEMAVQLTPVHGRVYLQFYQKMGAEPLNLLKIENCFIQ